MSTALVASAPPGRKVATLCGTVVVAAGLVVLLAWATGLDAVVRARAGQSAMAANSAVSVTLLGLGLVLAARGRDVGARFVAVLAGILPALSLIQIGSGRSLGIDLLILGDAQQSFDADVADPGRMSTGGAVGMLALALALLILRRHGYLAHGFAVLAVMVGYISVVGLLYGAEELKQVGGTSSIAAHAAVLLIVLGLGIVYLRPEIGLPSLLSEPGAIGSAVRRFSAFAAIVPAAVGYARSVGQQSGWYDTAMGLAIMTLSWTFGMLGLIWIGGRVALPVERQRDSSLDEAIAARQRFEIVADVSTAFASTLDLDQVLDRVTARLIETLADGCSIRLVDEKGPELVPATLRHRDPARLGAYAALLGRNTRVYEGIAGRVMRTRQSALIPDFAQVDFGGDSLPELQAAFDASGLGGAIVVPLVAQDRLFGLLVLMRDRGTRLFDERDLALCESVAARAALAIGKADLVTRQRRADAALTEFGHRALLADDAVEVAQLAVDLLHTTLDARYAFLMIEDGPDGPDGLDGLVVSAVAGPPGEVPVLGRGAPVVAVVPVEVYATGVNAVCDDMRNDEAKGMVEMGTLLAVDSGMAVPVPGDAGPRGVLSVTAIGVGRFRDDDLGFVTNLAGFLAAALDRVAAQQAVRAVAEERRALLERLVTAQEDERARIADGVHEDQVQVVTALDLRLGLLARRVAQQYPDLAVDVAFAREAVSGAADRLRDLLFDLQAPEADADLADALREVAAYLLDGSPTSWSVDSDSVNRLGQGHLTTMYRIGKEALTNVGRHAGAGAVRVHISDTDGGVLVSISDDGAGMAKVPGRSPAGHRGLTSMRDWAEVSGGWLSIESKPGRGTTVRYWLPGGSEGSPTTGTMALLH